MLACRLQGDRSAEFKEDVNTVRTNASYMYENFLPTGGTDVKVRRTGPSGWRRVLCGKRFIIRIENESAEFTRLFRIIPFHKLRFLS